MEKGEEMTWDFELHGMLNNCVTSRSRPRWLWMTTIILCFVGSSVSAQETLEKPSMEISDMQADTKQDSKITIKRQSPEEKAASIEDYKPSESNSIVEDFSVPFPVDI